MFENYNDILSQLKDAGLIVSDLKVDTAKPVRCGIDNSQWDVDAAKQKSAGWYHLASYLIEGKTYIIGAFGVWKGADNNRTKLELDKKYSLTPEQKKIQSARIRELNKIAAEERKREVEQAASRAQFIWSNYLSNGSSDYLERKGVQAHGIRFDPKGYGTIAIPMSDVKGKIWGLQLIRSDSAIKGTKKIQKKFEPKGLGMRGHFHMIGSPRELLLIAEGYATAATIHETTGLPVAVAFNANNLEPTAKELKKYHPNTKFVICADDDYIQKCQLCKKPTLVSDPQCQHCGMPHNQKNPGIHYAEMTANAVGGMVVVPNFIIDGIDIRNGEKLTDFNDLAMHQQGGHHLVRAQIEAITKEISGGNLPSATAAASQSKGEGERRPTALSIMPVNDLVKRFIYVDDVHGDNCFDTWTGEVVKDKKVKSLLPQFVRWDDVKSHPEWQGKAVYRDQIGFDPTESDSNIICNRWNGWPTKPNKNVTVNKSGVPKECEHLILLLGYLCDIERNGDDVFKWVLSWLAYPIQNPGAKLDTALIFHGPQGTGKNLFFEAYGEIFGEHFSVITQDTMEDQFNSDWVDRKLFVLADEIVAVQERTHVKNKLKTMITGDRIRINQKMIAAYPEKNFFNMVFLSNEANPVVLEKRDRRYLVIWTPEAMPEGFYNLVRQEIDKGASKALHNYLLNFDIGEFKPWSKPPMTRAKQDLILLNAETPYVFLHEWMTGNLDMPFCPAPAGLVYKVYHKWCQENGEKWPRTSRQFLSSIRSEGIRSEKENHFSDYKNKQDNKRTQFYIPSEKLMTYAKEHGEHVIEWDQSSKTKKDFFTECFMEFGNAFDKKYA
uniref:Primase n=1 Tax=Hydrogenovibrio crunogenus (strain DSM 25203 / XCL-2) TaxID=317025 RepID=Q31HV9_HYDCU